MKPQEISLYFKQGSSDKVYQVQLNKKNTSMYQGWYVNFQYGRRGRSLLNGTKTEGGTDYWSAKRIYDTLVRSKVRKGYKVAGEHTLSSYVPFQEQKVIEARTTDFLPQLPTTITLTQAKAIYNRHPDNIFLQTKHDGERRGLYIAGKVIASNKRSIQTQIQQNISDALGNLVKNWTANVEFDSEDMGSHVVIFDVLRMNGEVLRNTPYKDRAQYLRALQIAINDQRLEHLLKVDVPYQPENIDEFLDYINFAEETNEEGVIIRIGSGIYITGQQSQTDSTVFKLKFYEDAACYVQKINDQRSVRIAVENDRGGNYVEVGNVSIPPNREMPKVGSLVEVRYLYAYPNGSLYQPFYKGVLEHEKATTSGQLKYKKE